MKRIFSVFLIALFFIPSLACGYFPANFVVGSGNVVTQDFDVSNFDRITLEGSGDVYIEQGQTESLSVEADDNIIPVLDISVAGGELTLGIKEGVDITPSQSITYTITVEDLNGLALLGSGNFYVEPVNSNNFKISIPGSGDIEIESLIADDLSMDLNGSGSITLESVEVKTLDTSIRGSGDVKLEGKADTQEVTVDGSGNYLAGDLETDTANISVRGSADVKVWVTDELTIRVSGSGNIRYYGEPRLDQSGVGSADIISLGDK
ncbi:MAG: DUF2807 domain-containing protein [Chloroflexi bacterium]|nr:MAG: DUF2807 domain-containing protein [Chloroflexota bacterium]